MIKIKIHNSSYPGLLIVGHFERVSCANSEIVTRKTTGARPHSSTEGFF